MPQVPHPAVQSFIRRHLALISASILWSSTAIIQLAAQNPPETAGGRDAALGRHLAGDIEKRQPLLNDAEVDSYLQRLAERLHAVAGGTIPLNTKTVANPAPSAIALPGGYLFLSSGLIAAVRTEAELAAVLVHEIAHIAARHGTRPASKPTFGQVNVRLVFVGGWNGICARFAGPGNYPSSYQSLAAKFETEADEMGRNILVRTGYDPAALDAVFTRLVPGGGSAGTPDEAPPDTSTEFGAIRRRVLNVTQAVGPQGPTLRRDQD